MPDPLPLAETTGSPSSASAMSACRWPWRSRRAGQARSSASTSTTADRRAEARPRPHRRGRRAIWPALGELTLTADPRRCSDQGDLHRHRADAGRRRQPARPRRRCWRPARSVGRRSGSRGASGRADRGVREHGLSRRHRGHLRPGNRAGLGPARGTRFLLGYSPERINPGDRAAPPRQHRQGGRRRRRRRRRSVSRLSTAASRRPACHRAPDIRTAEAAKVIENAQRDINIAFINEVTMIFGDLGLSVYDVLDAARTKWNFLDFRPGLVGGHCIGVDPYYLAHCAAPARPRAGGHPRRPAHQRRHGRLHRPAHRRCGESGRPAGKPRSLVLGLTFKENLPDLRNSKVVDLIARLARRGHPVTCTIRTPTPRRRSRPTASSSAVALARRRRRLSIAWSAPSPMTSIAPVGEPISPGWCGRAGWSPISRASGADATCRPAASSGSFRAVDI